MVWFFGRKACGILAQRPGIEPAPLALTGWIVLLAASSSLSEPSPLLRFLASTDNHWPSNPCLKVGLGSGLQNLKTDQMS